MQQDSLTSQTLRRIIGISTSIKDSCASASSCSPVSPRPTPAPPISLLLPSPPSIEPKLINLGLDRDLAQKLSIKYAGRSEQLHAISQKCLHQAWRDLASLPRHAALLPLPQLLTRLVAAHSASYTRALQALERSALGVAHGFKSRLDERQSTKIVKDARQPFNQEFIPFLQTYFEHNAYPSAADRGEMAKKSMMEPRQIEVWFQNHRRRAKQEGRSVRKLGPADPAPFELCLKSMEEKMEPYLIPVGLRQSVDSEVSEAGSDDEDEDEDEFYNEKTEVVDLTDALNPPAARHAFPLKFKESRDVASTIFSTQHFSFPPPVWARKAATAPVKHDAFTIDELLSAFGSLHVHDSRKVLSPPFQIATTVFLPSAPLPSLVRGKFTFAPGPLAPATLNTIPAPRSRQHPFRSPTPCVQPAVPTPRRKKVAGPPRRTPKRAPKHRGASPATSDTSTLRSVSPPCCMPSYASSPPSRTPSLESNGFSPSRTPSFGSSGFSSRSSSSSSSGPTTPASSPVALPLEFSESKLFEMFGQKPMHYGSPVDGPESPPQQLFAFGRYAS
ncbi:hypothetical protein C8R47DRAFT_1192952 [Mycena vitilis]|nr:hypothetical protein C8R47DRAFT_1192952 [Mycena vitilis]